MCPFLPKGDKMKIQRETGQLGKEEMKGSIRKGTITIPLTDIELSFEVVERLYAAIRSDLKKRRKQNIAECTKFNG